MKVGSRLCTNDANDTVYAVLQEEVVFFNHCIDSVIQLALFICFEINITEETLEKSLE